MVSASDSSLVCHRCKVLPEQISDEGRPVGPVVRLISPSAGSPEGLEYYKEMRGNQ